VTFALGRVHELHDHRITAGDSVHELHDHDGVGVHGGFSGP
jgi:hypothetical protein